MELTDLPTNKHIRIYDYSPRSCPECGNIFRPTQNQAKRIGQGIQKTVFCSMNCFRQSKKHKASSIECPNCHTMFTPNRNQIRDSEIGRQKVSYCSSECYKKHIPEKRSGEQNPHWKGGKSTNHGYTIILQEGYYEKQKYVGEHILIMEDLIGRKLYKNEEVHHKNENKSDNRLDNLQLLTKNQHMTLHATKRHQETREHNHGNAS